MSTSFGELSKTESATVLGVSPPNGATAVGVNALLVVTFSEAVNPLTVDGSTIQVTGPGFTAMVVDDHPLVRESMVARLKMMGAREVVEAATIGEARARANLSGPRELCVLGLDAGAFEVAANLLELADIGGRDVVAAHLDRGLDLGIELDLLLGKVLLLL